MEDEEGKTLDLGFVAEADAVKTDVIHDFCDARVVPVVSPLGVGEESLPFAVNYVVDEPIQIVDDKKVVLPQLAAGMRFVIA